MERMYQVFRLRPRLILLTAAFVAGAAFFGGAAVLSKSSPGAVLGCGGVSLLFLLVAWRFGRTRALATAEGVKVYAPLFTISVGWREMREIVSSSGEIDAGMFSVYAPLIVRTDGRKVRVAAASSWSKAKVAEVVDQMEQLRRSQGS